MLNVEILNIVSIKIKVFIKCPVIGPEISFSLVVITPLLFEEFNGN